MSQNIKESVRHYVDKVYTHGNLDGVEELVTDDYVNHTQLQTVHGADGLRQFVAMIRTAFPDAQETIEDQVAEGDKEVHRWVIRGTHESEFMGIPATGKKITISGITISRVVDGKIAEEWTQADMMGLLQQLGALPSPAGTAD
jgi:steroid delta-isomerase-like uncharacterized protein